MWIMLKHNGSSSIIIYGGNPIACNIYYLFAYGPKVESFFTLMDLYLSSYLHKIFEMYKRKQ